MTIHHIQKSIIERLAKVKDLSFSELKQPDIDNKLFTYHLKQAVSNKLVHKNTAGRYELTMTGRKAWKRISLRTDVIVNRALSVIYVAVKNKDKWLVYKRKTHPFLDYYAFPHLIPDEHYDALKVTKDFLAPLGIIQPVVRATGFFRMLTESGAIESFTNFTLVYTECDSENLLPETEFAVFEWVGVNDIKTLRLMPNMTVLFQSLDRAGLEFIDRTLIIE